MLLWSPLCRKDEALQGHEIPHGRPSLRGRLGIQPHDAPLDQGRLPGEEGRDRGAPGPHGEAMKNVNNALWC